jgi:hypothetical protein
MSGIVARLGLKVDENVKYAYFLAAKNGDWQTMESYLDIDENVKYIVDPTTKKPAAIIVIENNHIEVLRAMLDRGVALYHFKGGPYVQSTSVLLLAELAASLGNINAIKVLAAVDDEVLDNSRSRNDNILVVAAKHNQRDLVEWLIDSGHMVPGPYLFLDIVNRGHLPLARWLMSTGRAGIDDFTAVMSAARDEDWKLLTNLLDICDHPDIGSLDDRGETFWNIIDWRALVTVHADNKDVLNFLDVLQDKVVLPKHVTRLMATAKIYTRKSYLGAARDLNWPLMSACLDEYFPLLESVDSVGKSAAMLIIDSGTRTPLSLLTRLNDRGALYYPHDYRESLIMLCIYAADTMKVDSIRELIGIGGDDLVTRLVEYVTDVGGLEIMKWLMENYEEIVLHAVRSEEGENVLALAILGDHLDIIKWLMDSCKLTTYEKSPLYYALANEDFPSISTALWLLKTGRTSNAELESELKHAIEKTSWTTATGLIEMCNVNIDEDHLWNSVDWSKMAKDKFKDVKLFLRALLPRIDFPYRVSGILMNTSSRRKDGSEIFIYRQMVLDGMKVREKVKKLDESRTRVVEKLDLPDDLIHDMLNTHLADDKRMGLSTETMWTSVQELP